MTDDEARENLSHVSVFDSSWQQSLTFNLKLILTPVYLRLGIASKADLGAT